MRLIKNNNFFIFIFYGIQSTFLKYPSIIIISNKTNNIHLIFEIILDNLKQREKFFIATKIFGLNS
jgi:hypothetical protein